MNTKQISLLISLLLLCSFSELNLAGAHAEETHEEESQSITFTVFIILNIIILLISFGLIFLIDNFQRNEKFISIKSMILIIITTLAINAIIAINTYVEVN
ncbi:MAG: hypothetical protein ACW99A_11915 [Candidatus Kariarchaeaceae archaeon]|jgi:heme/copper-type cytochrome/quinol oxidase subunit 2